MTITFKVTAEYTQATIKTLVKGKKYASRSISKVGYQQAVARTAQLWRENLRAEGEFYNSWNSPIDWS
jgi:hypothetical protein